MISNIFKKRKILFLLTVFLALAVMLNFTVPLQSTSHAAMKPFLKRHRVTPTPTPTAKPTLTLTPTPTAGSGGTLTPTSTPSSSDFPNASNTGVPVGTQLTTYTGSCVITTDNTVIDSKTVNCSDGLGIQAANVTIKNSKVNGFVFLDTDLKDSNNWSLTVQDSEVNDDGDIIWAAIGSGNVTVLRSNVHGGHTGVQCEEKSAYCVIQDSWIHGMTQIPNVDTHLGGFLSDGGQNISIIHNYIVCDAPVNNVGGGCTGDVNLIPNFAPISGALIQNNLFGANIDASFCTYGGEKSTSPTPHSDHIVYKDNVFQRGTNLKCGAYGPVAGFNPNNTGNQWVNNTWEDGALIECKNDDCE